MKSPPQTTWVWLSRMYCGLSIWCLGMQPQYVCSGVLVVKFTTDLDRQWALYWLFCDTNNIWHYILDIVFCVNIPSTWNLSSCFALPLSASTVSGSELLYHLLFTRVCCLGWLHAILKLFLVFLASEQNPSVISQTMTCLSFQPQDDLSSLIISSLKPGFH